MQHLGTLGDAIDGLSVKRYGEDGAVKLAVGMDEVVRFAAEALRRQGYVPLAVYDAEADYYLRPYDLIVHDRLADTYLIICVIVADEALRGHKFEHDLRETFDLRLQALDELFVRCLPSERIEVCVLKCDRQHLRIEFRMSYQRVGTFTILPID